jgi:cobalt-zinc-cadmium efflux system membrane fusion protein
VLGLALLWGFGVPALAIAQDSHAGHDDDADEKHGGDDHVEEVAEKDDHSGHDHSEHAEEQEEGLRLTPEQQKRFGLVVQPAGKGSLQSEVSLPGEIVFNEDRVVHMVPRVAGIAREVRKSVGDRVEAGETLAVIESRELADAKSEYLSAKARGALAEKNFIREKSLREKMVTSEQDYLESEQALAEARIELRSAEQKLHALGLPESAVERLDTEHDEAITRYEIRSPIAGVVTAKHISLGESLEADADIFTVVDTSTVWVNLAVYTKNLGAIHVGQDVRLRVDHSGAQGLGKIAMLTPFVEESTRSAMARVVLDNTDGRWMPGTFVTGFSSTAEESLPVVVPRDAVQTIEGREVVFVEHKGAFQMTPVTLGRGDKVSVEVTIGLEAGTRYVSGGAFQLKATVITSNLGSHAGHGH